MFHPSTFQRTAASLVAALALATGIGAAVSPARAAGESVRVVVELAPAAYRAPVTGLVGAVRY